jgi:hypothetical protein
VSCLRLLHSFPLLLKLAVRLVTNLLRLSLAALGGGRKQLLLSFFLLLDEVVEFALLVLVLRLHGLDLDLQFLLLGFGRSFLIIDFLF